MAVQSGLFIRWSNKITTEKSVSGKKKEKKEIASNIENVDMNQIN